MRYLILLCTTLLLSTTLSAQSCRADFFFHHLSDGRVLFVDHSSEAGSRQWNFGEGEILHGRNSRVQLVQFPNDTTEVCLQVFGANACTDEFCTSVYPNAPNAMCNITDCVWPGDANGDRQANVYDVLSLGIGYGSTGPARGPFTIPSSAYDWLPDYSDDWNNWINTVNFKHLDCDGNGLIDDRDVFPVVRNYSPDSTYVSSPTRGAVPLSIELQDQVILVDSTMTEIKISIDVFLGDETQPVEDLYGIAFSLRFNEEGDMGNTMFNVLIPEASPLGTVDELLTLGVPSRVQGQARYDFAATRTDGAPVSGSGKLVTFSRVIMADIIGGRKIQDVNVILEKVKAIDRTGSVIPYDTPRDSSTVFIVASSTVDPDEDLTGGELRLFPNPVRNLLTLDMFDLQSVQKIEVFNGLGQRILTRNRVEAAIQQIDLSDLEGGTYQVRVTTAQSSYTRSFIKH